MKKLYYTLDNSLYAGIEINNDTYYELEIKQIYENNFEIKIIDDGYKVLQLYPEIFGLLDQINVGTFNSINEIITKLREQNFQEEIDESDVEEISNPADSSFFKKIKRFLMV